MVSDRAKHFHAWVVEHDERWLFVALYIGLAVVLSIWISLFWLVVVVAVHALFEWIRQRTKHDSPGRVFLEALWEIKLDLALVFFALALALYMEVILGVLGLQSAARLGAAARAGTRTGTRALAWQRAIRGFLLSVDDIAQIARAFFREKKRDGLAQADSDTQSMPLEGETVSVAPAVEGVSSWRQPWGWGARISIGLGAVCLVLMVLSPVLTHHTVSSALATLAVELHPYPAN